MAILTESGLLAGDRLDPTVRDASTDTIAGVQLSGPKDYLHMNRSIDEGRNI